MIDQLERAHKELERSLAKAKARADEFRGPCHQCRFYREGAELLLYTTRYCHHPLAGHFSFDDTTGREKFNGYRISGPGLVPEVCGDNRILWEAKPSLIDRFFDWIENLTW